MKFFTVVNMHADFNWLVEQPKVHLVLHKEPPAHRDLNQQVILVEIAVPEADAIIHTEYVKNKHTLPDGLHCLKSECHEGWWYNGAGALVTVLDVTAKAKLEDLSNIPHIKLIATVANPNILTEPRWAHNETLAEMVDTYKPKWGATGYILGKHSDDQVVIAYIPVTVNVENLTAIISQVAEAFSGITDKLESTFDDHGTDADLLSFL